MRYLLPGVVALLLITACGSAKTSSPKTAEEYFQEGEAFFERQLYEDAIASWEKVRETFYSPELNALAELKIAESHYLAKHYVEAAIAYDDFLKQHPTHPRTPQVLFQLGMSHYRQVQTLDRDQTATRNTLLTFDNFLTRFPNDPRVPEVRRIMNECRERLAAHELYVGRFYLRSDHPQAAIDRLEAVMATYPDTVDHEQGYFYLGQAYLQAGRRVAAEEVFAKLEREYPQSKLADEARKELRKNP